MKLVYPAVFTPCIEKEGFTVIVPDLPGCVSEGNSLSDAIEMATDAASGWILVITHDSESFISLLLLDIDAYAEKYGDKTVRKNITIPAWLNAYGEKNHINFSKVLQNALFSMSQNFSEK